MPSEKPLIYLVLGAAGSGRREVIADLIEGGLEAGERAAVLLAEGEAAASADAQLGAIGRWRWTDDGTIEGALPAGAARVFFVTDGRRNPVDQIEAFAAWLATAGSPDSPQGGGELARVLCVANCQLAEMHPPLLAWFDACVHFSDVVLLNRREGVANKWLSDFLARYRGQFLPCLFEFVKGGRVKNPALVLEPQARRMSHVFDAEPDWVVTGKDGAELDDDELEGEEGEEEVEAAPEVDPYFARDAAGRRAKRIPDIAKFLEGSEGARA